MTIKCEEEIQVACLNEGSSCLVGSRFCPANILVVFFSGDAIWPNHSSTLAVSFCFRVEALCTRLSSGLAVLAGVFITVIETLHTEY